MWKDTLAPYKHKTKVMVKRFLVTDMLEWAEKGKKAFEDVKRALVEAIETSYFDPEMKTACLATRVTSSGAWW